MTHHHVVKYNRPAPGVNPVPGLVAGRAGLLYFITW